MPCLRNPEFLGTNHKILVLKTPYEVTVLKLMRERKKHILNCLAIAVDSPGRASEILPNLLENRFTINLGCQNPFDVFHDENVWLYEIQNLQIFLVEKMAVILLRNVPLDAFVPGSANQ